MLMWKILIGRMWESLVKDFSPYSMILFYSIAKAKELVFFLPIKPLLFKRMDISNFSDDTLITMNLIF